MKRCSANKTSDLWIYYIILPLKKDLSMVDFPSGIGLTETWICIRQLMKQTEHTDTQRSLYQ